MKKLLFMIMLLVAFNASAQTKLSITGKVTGQDQKPINGATVFIGGTQLATATNADGTFELTIHSTGSYHLLVKMLGYTPFGKDLRLTDKPIDLNISLTVKTIQLHAVNVGGDKNWAKNYAVFKNEFLGKTDNAKGCTILNPDVIYFSTRGIQLYANADDFLIIENKRLGYRIKYLLQTFRHQQNTVNTAYSGDAVFEELPGNDEQKQERAKNRLETYRGSMLHFFRAVFADKVIEQGFLVKQMLRDRDNWPVPAKHLVNFDTLVTPIDSTFFSLRFKDLAISYNPKKVAKLLKININPPVNGAVATPDLTWVNKAPKYDSELVMHLSQTVIDSRGSVPWGYFLTFLFLGNWIEKRVGDQLPFEYQPPVSTSIAP